ncbi:hypothetical protein Aple_075440 [Acrocarpospora pleiomorpha]|uniref:Uncharacterized protein n=1 Tax=Acrocarpospora pleiomorpha TaxID=90975 RepID=A0A5M3XTR9_9ACTN|nr:hypothetical protein Aple_075440 [Acrocarpospora pleiomorpha]
MTRGFRGGDQAAARIIEAARERGSSLPAPDINPFWDTRVAKVYR